jgi:hypothetical protein
MSTRDRVTIGFSAIALAVSLLSAYYNIFRQSDDLSIVVSFPPMPDEEGELTLRSASHELYGTFVNSGNRAAVIGSVSLWFPQRATQAELNCRELDLVDSQVPLVMEPWVLKEKEVVIRTLKPNDSLIEKDGSLMIPLAFEAKKARSWWVGVCLSLGIVTPSGASSANILLLDYDIKNPNLIAEMVGKFRGSHMLLKRTGSILW